MINKYILEGKIVPASVTVGLLKTAMELSGGTHFLIDGFPRDLDNLHCWEKEMNSSTQLLFLLFLDCDETLMTERLLERGKSSGRSDDNIETIKKRFIVYEEQTRPIVNHFTTLNMVKKVDANGTQDEVYSQVKTIFDAIHDKKDERVFTGGCG
jgi:UMP-CMP kinase